MGLDISEKMLERAIEKRGVLRREARERVHLVQGDMTNFDLGEQFRTVLIPFPAIPTLAGDGKTNRLLELRAQSILQLTGA